MNRIKLITDCVRRTKGPILHVGCAGADSIRDSSMWLHGHVVRAAGQRQGVDHAPVVGVDIDRDRVLEMQRWGYAAETCDVLDLGARFPAENFNLIIAGEIIEHIPDQVGFLRACRSVLSSKGVLLISTPSPFGIAFVPWYWLTGREYTGSGHVLWHSPRTLAGLAALAGLRLAAVHHCTYGAGARRWWALPLTLAELWPAMRPTVVYELVRSEAPERI
jgi:SAM-dependent methyltransferase